MSYYHERYIIFDQHGQLIPQKIIKLPAGVTRNHVKHGYNAKAKEGGMIGTFPTIEGAVSAQESFTGHVKGITFNTCLGMWVFRRKGDIAGEFDTQEQAIAAQAALLLPKPKLVAMPLNELLKLRGRKRRKPHPV